MERLILVRTAPVVLLVVGDICLTRSAVGANEPGWDTCTSLWGAILSQLLLSRFHDRQLAFLLANESARVA